MSKYDKAAMVAAMVLAALAMVLIVVIAFCIHSSFPHNDYTYVGLLTPGGEFIDGGLVEYSNVDSNGMIRVNIDGVVYCISKESVMFATGVPYEEVK